LPAGLRAEQGWHAPLTDHHRHAPPKSGAESRTQADLDGELCGVRPDGTTSFSAIQAASDAGKSDALIFFVFDLLYLDGEKIGSAPLIDRKGRLQELLTTVPLPLQYTDHQNRRRRGVL
jgi:ATP-dependent DNA ligase